MKNIFIIASALLVFSCTQKPVQPETAANKPAEKRTIAFEQCAVVKKLNGLKDGHKITAILKAEATDILGTSHMILASDENEYFCEESKMLTDKTYTLIEQSLCFEQALAKYYDLKAKRKLPEFAAAQKAYYAKVANAEKVYNFKLPLSTKKCNPYDYVSPHKDAPLSDIVPMAKIFLK